MQIISPRFLLGGFSLIHLILIAVIEVRLHQLVSSGTGDKGVDFLVSIMLFFVGLVLVFGAAGLFRLVYQSWSRLALFFTLLVALAVLSIGVYHAFAPDPTGEIALWTTVFYPYASIVLVGPLSVLGVAVGALQRYLRSRQAS